VSLSFFNVDGKTKEQMMADLAVTRAAKLKGRTSEEE
jgi:hypothetical protein